MIINVNKLKEAGLEVKVFERNGLGEAPRAVKLHDGFIELRFEGGHTMTQGIVDGVKDMVNSKTYREALLNNLASRIHEIQIMEAIAAADDPGDED